MMKIVTPLRLGIFGAICLAAGMLWFATLYRSYEAALQWNVDARLPYALRLTVLVGFWIVVASLLCGATIWFRRSRGKSRS